VPSKVIRWHDGDEEDVLELQQAQPLSQDVLLERYVHAMTHVNGSPQRIDLDFIECIARRFGATHARCSAYDANRCDSRRANHERWEA
jgi:hypothetical protein